MKKVFSIVWIVCAALFVASCGKTKSYTDMLKDEEKAIDRLIAQEGIEILNDFPADTVFEENQFVRLDDDVLLNIIDRGSSDRAVLYDTKILYRCIVSYPMDTTYIWNTGYCTWSDLTNWVLKHNYGPNSNGTLPYPASSVAGMSVPFTYGDYSSRLSTELSHTYVSEGLQMPLRYVGDRARVKLIVPFRVGSYMDQSNGQPVYYEVLEYIFDENL